ncbi:MAG: hypothetical protein P0S95_07505 [Rhabdochlamydiaceae bacterium]|nr:hypothetical protein [Candidatus Amphrikana amoebophyrae]
MAAINGDARVNQQLKDVCEDKPVNCTELNDLIAKITQNKLRLKDGSDYEMFDIGNALRLIFPDISKLKRASVEHNIEKLALDKLVEIHHCIEYVE